MSVKMEASSMLKSLRTTQRDMLPPSATKYVNACEQGVMSLMSLSLFSSLFFSGVSLCLFVCFCFY